MSDEFNTGNLGAIAGYSPDSGLGFEAFYMVTAAKDSDSGAIGDYDIYTNTWGLLGVYKSTGDIYIKGKLGVAIVDLQFDVEGPGSIDDTTAGLAYGIAIGTALGNGNLELAYTVLPSMEEFRDVDFDADFDMIAVSYLWTF
jgi:hypothetical protein